MIGKLNACFRLVVGSLVLLSACKKEEGSAWNARVARFEARIKKPGAGYRSQTSLGPEGLVAPLTDVSRPLGIGAVVRIANSELVLEGEHLGPVDDETVQAVLMADLATMAHQYTVQRPGRPTNVYFMLAPEVSSATLLKIVALLPLSMPARLLVRHGEVLKINPIPEGASKDARQEIEKVMSATGPDRMSAFSNAVFRNLEPCAPARAAFGRVVRADASEKEAILIRDLPPALERCPFEVDIDVVEGVFVAMLTPAGPPMGWLPLDLDKKDVGATELIDVAANVTVGKLATALSDAERAGARAHLVHAAGATHAE